MPAAIDDYALIGDCRAAALVSRFGDVDWLCWPRFDSPPSFGALLDRRGGRFRVAPAGARPAGRRYLPETNVVETRFVAPGPGGGAATLTDLMPVASDAEKRALSLPEHELLRLVTCDAGEVDLEIHFDPRADFGARPLRWRDAGRLGLRAERGRALLVLRSDVRLRLGDDGARGRVRLRAGERVAFSLTYSEEAPAVLPPLGDRALAALERTERWWRAWAARATYRGPHRDAVVRSALALKLLAYAPSGAIVAAPTTSLPERPGGPLNWDYRYCWLRDAAFTVRALHDLGYDDEAAPFVSWLLHATRLTRPELKILYDVYGRPPGEERARHDLDGYAGSRPVRFGNAAWDQLQLDVYGEVLDAAAYLLRDGDGPLDHETARLFRDLGDYVCANWRRPDEGIWEVRSGPREHTHSRVLCWTALDRLLELGARGRLPRLDGARLRRQRDAIRDDVEARGWNPRLQSYVAVLDGAELDAALLLLPAHGYVAASAPRMVATVARVWQRLGAADGLLYRYLCDESPGEGAFAICSFWALDAMARGAAPLADARALFDRLLGYANDVGLFAEEIDPASGAALGNFPQAYTHVGLINAALSLAEAERRGERAA